MTSQEKLYRQQLQDPWEDLCEQFPRDLSLTIQYSDWLREHQFPEEDALATENQSLFPNINEAICSYLNEEKDSWVFTKEFSELNLRFINPVSKRSMIATIRERAVNEIESDPDKREIKEYWLNRRLNIRYSEHPAPTLTKAFLFLKERGIKKIKVSDLVKICEQQCIFLIGEDLDERRHLFFSYREWKQTNLTGSYIQFIYETIGQP